MTDPLSAGSEWPSDDEEPQWQLEALGRLSPGDASTHPQSPACGGGPRSGPGPAPAPAAAASTSLGLHFNSSAGGQGPGTCQLSWRDGRFSDWPVRVADRTYHLHTFLLARASSFFEAQTRRQNDGEQKEAGIRQPGSDLTQVLPVSCHGVFEDALDFIYSENQATFEAPPSKALFLLKVADVLGIVSLLEAMVRRIEAGFPDTAPLLLEQYCQLGLSMTTEGDLFQQIREITISLIVNKFQRFLSIPEMKSVLLRLPFGALAEVLEADDILVANEDTVFNFVAERVQQQCDLQELHFEEEEGPQPADAAAGPGGKAAPEMRSREDEQILWQRVRWAHLSTGKFVQALAMGLRPETALNALTARVAHLDLGGFLRDLSGMMPEQPPRRPILPAGLPPPTSMEIDFCFYYTEQYSCGEALRSNPKRIGDMVLRVLVFPAGTATGVARGSLSVFLEAVPQPHWPRDWEFTNIRYAIACIRWPTANGEWASKKKSDLWSFKASRLDRGWHDFLAPGEIVRYLSPEGFVCIRGALEPECLGQVFLQGSHMGPDVNPSPSAEVAGSSASRRGSWPPRFAQPGGGGAAAQALPSLADFVLQPAPPRQPRHGTAGRVAPPQRVSTGTE